MNTHVLGFPRIGANRELKRALESYWRREISETELTAVADALKMENWRTQSQAGLAWVTTGDFSFYDHILDTIALVGAVPERFGWNGESVDLDTYFRMARGDVKRNLSAMEMTKWFDANYHYIVPEITPRTALRRGSSKVVTETRQAINAGYEAKPVLVGPVTFLSVAKEFDGANRWDCLEALTAIYCEVIRELADLGCEWIQVDEPILATDLSEAATAAFETCWPRLTQAAGSARVMLSTYFGPLNENLGLATESGAHALHVDLVRGPDQLDAVLNQAPSGMTVSLGLVDGRNIWKTDLARAAKALERARDQIGADRVLVGSSCSLLHSPVDLTNETLLADELKNWMAFAVQKCDEVAVLGRWLAGGDVTVDMEANASAIASRRAHAEVVRPEVRERAAAVTPDMLSRQSPYPQRAAAQKAWLKLPLLPTTTIGSFPQTTEIRQMRLKTKKGDVDPAAYEAFIQAEIQSVVDKQEALGLDVLVHGEPERNDMVEYFGQQLDGFCFTRNGWVQSYGSRCVKPPIIYGDVSRPRPMTVEWSRYAQSLTKKPMKGMLTGPVTILCWSFVRDDLSRAEVCQQIALAIRDEVQDLETAGIRVIQIDEAALREGLPLRRADHAAYLRWAVDSFRLTASGVEDATQIHTHMCYSEFNAIIKWIADMDADVISIESSRSKMELLDAFRQFDYPNEIGPGVYDIHSPRVPSKDEVLELLQLALKDVPKERLWVNPDCGLKTRAWPETIASLENMVSATLALRAKLE